MKSLFLVMRWGKGRETRGDEPKERSPGHAHPDEEKRRVLMMPGSVGVGLWCGGCGDHGGACQGRREKKTKKPAKHSKKAGGYILIVVLFFFFWVRCMHLCARVGASMCTRKGRASSYCLLHKSRRKEGLFTKEALSFCCLLLL